MKQISTINAEPIRTSYTPLVSRFGIIASGGAKTQHYYADENAYIPDRSLTPLVLKATLNVADPDKIIANGDKSSELSCVWYENSVQITADNSNYTLNADKTLTVKRNVSPTAPIGVRCVATYVDSRTGNSLIFEDTVMFSTIQKTDDKLAVFLDKPEKLTYNPIKDTNLIDITATLKKGENSVPDAQAKYWWYIVNSGVETLIDQDNTAIEYVSGQGTKTLRLNADNTPFSIIRCRAAYYTGTAPVAPADATVMAEFTLVYKTPQTKVVMTNKNGYVIRPGMATMEFGVKIEVNNEVLSSALAENHFFVKWVGKATTAGATEVQLGHGHNISIPVASLKVTGGMMEVKPVVYECGPYYPLVALVGSEYKLKVDNQNRILIGK